MKFKGCVCVSELVNVCVNDFIIGYGVVGFNGNIMCRFLLLDVCRNEMSLSCFSCLCISCVFVIMCFYVMFGLGFRLNISWLARFGDLVFVFQGWNFIVLNCISFSMVSVLCGMRQFVVVLVFFLSVIVFMCCNLVVVCF